MTAPQVVNATLNFGFTVTEALQGIGDVAGNQNNFVHSGLSRLLQLSPTTVPPAANYVLFSGVIGGGGTVDIDLTAAPTTQGAFDMTGLSVHALAVVNAATHDFTVAPGASNAYSLPETLTVHANGGRAWRFYPAVLVDVDATHKMIRITGTAGDAVLLGLLLG
jgi:hypothetical protein